MAVHPGIIPGWPGYLRILGYLVKGGWHTAVHPRIIQGWPSYMGIPRYLDKGEYMAVYPGIIPG